MKIKMNETVLNEKYGTMKKGAEINVDKDLAKALIEVGKATDVK